MITSTLLNLSIAMRKRSPAQVAGSKENMSQGDQSYAQAVAWRQALVHVVVIIIILIDM